MLSVRRRISILWDWNRRVTPLPFLEGTARCSLCLCLDRPKLCGIYYAMPTITPPPLLVCVCVYGFCCVCACPEKYKDGREMGRDHAYVCVCVKHLWMGLLM